MHGGSIILVWALFAVGVAIADPGGRAYEYTLEQTMVEAKNGVETWQKSGLKEIVLKGQFFVCPNGYRLTDGAHEAALYVKGRELFSEASAPPTALQHLILVTSLFKAPRGAKSLSLGEMALSQVTRTEARETIAVASAWKSSSAAGQIRLILVPSRQAPACSEAIPSSLVARPLTLDWSAKTALKSFEAKQRAERASLDVTPWLKALESSVPDRNGVLRLGEWLEANPEGRGKVQDAFRQAVKQKNWEGTVVAAQILLTQGASDSQRIVADAVNIQAVPAPHFARLARTFFLVTTSDAQAVDRLLGTLESKPSLSPAEQDALLLVAGSLASVCPEAAAKNAVRQRLEALEKQAQHLGNASLRTSARAALDNLESGARR